MDKYGLMRPIRKANPYRRMAIALKTNHTADNLLDRKFTKYGPRKVLLTDITYIRIMGYLPIFQQYWMPIQDRYCHMF